MPHAPLPSLPWPWAPAPSSRAFPAGRQDFRPGVLVIAEGGQSGCGLQGCPRDHAELWPRGTRHFSARFCGWFTASCSLVLPHQGPPEMKWTSQGLLISSQNKLIEGNSLLGLRLQHWSEILVEGDDEAPPGRITSRQKVHLANWDHLSDLAVC